MGELVFRKIQYGKESTRGTAVPATGVWPGTIKVPADRKPKFPAETLGIRARAQRSVVNQIGLDGINLTMDDAIFQKLPILFLCALKGGVTALEQTTGQDDYLWDFTPSLSASNAPNSMTLEYGDDVQAFEMEYAMIKRLVISGRIGADEPVKVEAELFAKQITPTTFTASLSAIKGEAMIANLTKLYIDSSWANLGNTQKTDLLREYSIEIQTGLHPKFFANGAKTMSSHGEGYLDLMATLTFEGNAAADGYYDDFLAGTEHSIRLLIEGGQIGSGENHSLTVDMFGSFEEVIPLDSAEDGNNLHAAVFHAHSDRQSTPHLFAVKVITDQNTV